jgi:hypothetical protein
MHRTDGIDEFHRFDCRSVWIIDVGGEPISRYAFDVITEQVNAREVGVIPAVIMVPQPIQELVEPLQEHIVVPVARVFLGFTYLWLFRPGWGNQQVPYFPMNELLYPLEHYRIVIMLGVPEPMTWRSMGHSICR